MLDLNTLDDLPSDALADRAVLVRVDFNVPLQDGKVADRNRIREALPTLLELASRRAKLLLVSHLGRPEGKRREDLSLRDVASALREELGHPVTFVEDSIGEPVRKALASLAPGGICLLENVRFNAGEERNDPELARALAAPASCYVSDAFGTAHRAHASTVGAAELLPLRAAGRLMEREVAALSRLLEPEHPYVALLGGAKISGKIELLERLLESVDALLVGGGMANTFLAAQGLELGRSLVETEQLETARTILESARERGVDVVLPLDVVVTRDLDAPEPDARTVAVAEIPAHSLAVDLGAATVAAFRPHLERARTVFWNGPMGVFEKPPFDRGSLAVAELVAACTGFSVLGGGETALLARRAGVVGRLGHVSTGGGAALELISGRTLPGLAVLERSRVSRPASRRVPSAHEA